MTQSDLPAGEPVVSNKPSALGGVMAERSKRKAAEAKALAAEREVELLRQQVDDLEEKLRLMSGRAARFEELAKRNQNASPEGLAALGLHLNAKSGTISGSPPGGGLRLADLGKKFS